MARVVSVDIFLPTGGPILALPIGAPGGRIVVPVHFRAVVDDPAKPFTVDMEVRIPVEGERAEARIESVTVALRPEAPDGIDTTSLRLPLKSLTKLVMKSAARHLAGMQDGVFASTGLVADDDADFDARFRDEFPRGVHAVTDQKLEQAAGHYRAALANPAWRRRATEYVREQMHVSRATAARYVTRARARGFLGPAIGTRAGEAE